MKAKNIFEETKIKMVMKLRGLTRDAAIKALRLDNPPDRKEVEGHQVSMLDEALDKMDGDGDFLSAAEFFKD